MLKLFYEKIRLVDCLSAFVRLARAFFISENRPVHGRHRAAYSNGNIFLHAAEYGVSRAQLLYTNFFPTPIRIFLSSIITGAAAFCFI